MEDPVSTRDPRLGTSDPGASESGPRPSRQIAGLEATAGGDGDRGAVSVRACHPKDAAVGINTERPASAKAAGGSIPSPRVASGW